MADSETPACTGPRTEPWSGGSLQLRIGAIFIILASSAVATLTPVITRKVDRLTVPAKWYDCIKYFGSGVIIATAFCHLLAPGADELGSPCLNEAFRNYPFAFAFALIALYLTFIVNITAFRTGALIAQRLVYSPEAGGHHHAAEHLGQPAAQDRHAEEGNVNAIAQSDSDPITQAPSTEADKEIASTDDLSIDEKDVPLSAAASEILGVAVLEFGVIFHSVIIGITLGTTNDFTVLFIVIIFHQMFEGLGLGSRLALLPLPKGSWIPWIGAFAYSCVTPVGLAIGLAVRHSYNEDSATANYVTGTFDSVSAGILIYTGCVELLAHDFVFNDKMRKAPARKVALNIVQMLFGAGCMSLLARWA